MPLVLVLVKVGKQSKLILLQVIKVDSSFEFKISKLRVSVLLLIFHRLQSHLMSYAYSKLGYFGLELVLVKVIVGVTRRLGFTLSLKLILTIPNLTLTCLFGL